MTYLNRPAWNCTSDPDGPHYTPTPFGPCHWCGKGREQIRAEWEAYQRGFEAGRCADESRHDDLAQAACFCADGISGHERNVEHYHDDDVSRTREQRSYTQAHDECCEPYLDHEFEGTAEYQECIHACGALRWAPPGCPVRHGYPTGDTSISARVLETWREANTA